ncbi:sarcosine oxidase subunit gamma [Arthrobacter sp. TES]|uniref:sarcosine oxidase subunit gamma n=1 Tax=Paenarthrobacter ureafaciens TaxID=37931 RepID=UPI0003975ABF|nr:sarcosine oxidase subunit gamma family protein [Paenarthrobacter ureafaciens]AOY73764.1 sarcosine oxidase subunit gamma [Arthrobacter sp. ZXY-2]ERI36098.1 sarcosine oxidase subunit gamma [Arthrobacter sp. AK-YN10]QOI61892.1 sarcosine oxidase subunit gamma [Arthrobacter sp. TES]BCW85942.1 sarcosine oxidase subunit gamma [Arthrobacter sp. NicSoilE8]MEC3853038.1 sarcosine oxidase subunit gamma family protein [Paenarthrobacter ureafaciens]
MAETATPAQPVNAGRVREARRSPAQHLAEAFAAGSVAGKVTLKEIPYQTQVGVRVNRTSDAGSRVAAITGGLPAACGEVTGSGAISTLWLGPTEFLVVAPEESHDSFGGSLVSDLTAALGSDSGQVVDLSANRTTFELSGSRARAVLEKSCALDLHPRVLKAGTALSTEIGHIPVVLWKTDDQTFRIFPRASFADFLGRWLLDSMREYASPEVP